MHVHVWEGAAVRAVAFARYWTIRLGALLGMIGMLVAPRPARAAEPSVFVSVDSLPDGPERDAFCGAVWEALGLPEGGGSPPRCERLHSAAGLKAWHRVRDAGPGLRVAIERRRKGALLLRIRRWGVGTPRALVSTDWTLPAGPSDIQRGGVRERLREFLAAEAAVRGTLLPPGDGAGGGGRVGLDAGAYAARAVMGMPELELASLLQRPDSLPRPNYWGTALDIGALFAVASIEYVLDPSTNAKDWKYDFSFDTLTKKFITFQGLQFDDNDFRLNSGHAMSGTLYFLAARSRHLPFWQSFLAAVIAAWWWEISTEFREVVSVNDVILTPVGGLAIGESLFQLATFFRLSEDTWWNQVLADFLSGPPFFVWVRDHSVPGGVRLLDEAGYTVQMWHRLRLVGGPETIGGGALGLDGTGGTGALVGVDCMLVQRPEYDRPGEARAWVAEALSTRLRLRVALGTAGAREISALAQTSYAGFYTQQVYVAEGGLWGHAAFATIGALFEYDEHRVGAADQLVAASPVGPVLHLALYQGALRLRATAELHPVFGQVRALGWPAYQAAGGDLTGTSAVLLAHDYYYAFGVRPAFRLVAEYRRAEAGVEAHWYALESAEGLLRDTVHQGPLAADHRQAWTAWLAHDLPLRNVRAVLQWEHRALNGQVNGVMTRSADSRALLLFNLTL